MIYLDNAATSFPKPKRVIRAVNECIAKYCGNPGRSSHRLALAAADKIFETREILSDFVGSEKCENIIFTPNATYALNLVIKGLIKKKCHCIVSDMEHNSVLRPLYKLMDKYGVEISFFNSDLPLSEAITPLIRNDTEVLVSTLCSNVTGKSVDLDGLSRIAKDNSIKLILDASQYVGHIRTDLTNVCYTAFCSAGHKSLFGIQGSGFAIINDHKLFDTLTEGGSGFDTFSKYMPELLPERYEAGTPSTPAIVSLGEGIRYINSVGIENIEKHILSLTDLLQYELLAIPGIKLYGANNGIAAFNIRDIPSSRLSEILDKRDVATRSGFHCAPTIHTKLGTTEGAVRVSISYLNTANDIYALSSILKRI